MFMWYSNVILQISPYNCNEEMYIKLQKSVVIKIAGYLACVVEVISCEVQWDHWCCFHFHYWWKWFHRFDVIYQFPFWFINLDLWCLVSRWGLGRLICRTIIQSFSHSFILSIDLTSVISRSAIKPSAKTIWTACDI